MSLVDRLIMKVGTDLDILWIICVLLGILTIMFLTGKGSFLIAGYNTSSKEKKAQYDEKKLCRVMGIGLGIITISILIGILGDISEYTMPVGMIIGIAVMLVGSTFFCKNKNYIKEQNSSNRKSMIISVVMVLATCVFVCVVMYTGEVKAEIKDDTIVLSASLVKGTEIDIDSIVKLDYSDQLDVGKRKNGVGNAIIQAGRFQNGEFGRYVLYSYDKSKEYIIVETDSQIYVINRKTPKETQELYKEMKMKWNEEK